MHALIQLKRATPPFVIAVLLSFFAFSPKTQAVVPAPDGGYPGFNTAEGTNALKNLTTGVGNAAVGWYSLFSNTDGSYNTAVGAGTLLFNIGDQSALEGVENTAVGAAALLFNTTGTWNTATGALALSSNTTGRANSAFGRATLSNNTTANNNTASGNAALHSNTTGSGNTAIGASSLADNSIGFANTAVAAQALQNNTTGTYNTALGWQAGSNVTTASHVICIGAEVIGANVDNSCYIGSVFGQASASGAPVLINSSNKLGTSTSAKRFKEDITPMEKASEVVFALKPVAFRYKKEIDPAGTSQFGLVAEDVEKVNPDLVVRDQEGKPYSVRYDQVNAMLLNEFLKEHRTVQELKKEIAALKAGLQKVSAQLEARKPAPQVVGNNR
jgi:hypothetical protein